MSEAKYMSNNNEIVATLRQALEAFNKASHDLYRAASHFDTHQTIEKVDNAITSLRAAIASYSQAITTEESSAVQEPVAWPTEEQPDGTVIPVDPSEMTNEQLEKYTHPPVPQGHKPKAEQEPVAWMYEDELPKSYPYNIMFPYSKVDGVRMFPVFGPKAKEDKEFVATVIEHHAFTDGIVRFDGIENMDQLPIGTKLYTHPPVPQGHKPKADHIPDATKMVEQELVGYLTGEHYDGYPVFLSVQKLNDYEIDTTRMTEVFKNAQPKAEQEPVISLQCFHCQDTIETLNDKVMSLIAQPKAEHGNPENMYVEMCKHLNCPHCGGSGHIDDVAEQEPKREWVSLTDEEWVEIDRYSTSHTDFRKRIDAKLKEKNTIIHNYPEKDN